MDISIVDVRSAMTVVQLAVFLAIVWWAYSGVRKSRFDVAARIPFEDDDGSEANAGGGTPRQDKEQ